MSVCVLCVGWQTLTWRQAALSRGLGSLFGDRSCDVMKITSRHSVWRINNLTGYNKEKKKRTIGDFYRNSDRSLSTFACTKRFFPFIRATKCIIIYCKCIMLCIEHFFLSLLTTNIKFYFCFSDKYSVKSIFRANYRTSSNAIYGERWISDKTCFVHKMLYISCSFSYFVSLFSFRPLSLSHSSG